MRQENHIYCNVFIFTIKSVEGSAWTNIDWTAVW